MRIFRTASWHFAGGDAIPFGTLWRHLGHMGATHAPDSTGVRVSARIQLARSGQVGSRCFFSRVAGPDSSANPLSVPHRPVRTESWTSARGGTCPVAPGPAAADRQASELNRCEGGALSNRQQIAAFHDLTSLPRRISHCGWSVLFPERAVMAMAMARFP
jgi:hypothetical protein